MTMMRERPTHERRDDVTSPLNGRNLDRWLAGLLAIFAIPLIVAIFTDAALTWDGGYLLFRTLDMGRPFYAHDRLINAPLNWPVLLVDRLTDSMAVLRATFGAIHVVTPLVSLSLSWWVVRKRAPALIIWPILGIGLATLPGQMNFISEGIKAHQLTWPVLLAVLVGLPKETIPMTAMVSLVIMYLHPAAVLIFAAIAAAALVLAHLRPDHRERLTPFAHCLIIAAVLRYGMIAGSYESGEMGIENQKKQWLASATGFPGVALAMTFVTAAIMLGEPLIQSRSRWTRYAALIPAVIAFGALIAWAFDPSLWWDALDFRGPTNVVSLGIAGFAFLDTVLAHRMNSSRHRSISELRKVAASMVVVIFAVVLSIQSVQFGRAIDNMNETLASSSARCYALANLPGMPESPLNLWTTPSLSLLYQGWVPEKIVLQGDDCERARENGSLAIEESGTAYNSDRIDLVPLQWELSGNGACWWEERGGWHPVEVSDTARWRWSDGAATIRLFVGEAVTLSFIGMMVSFAPDNRVDMSLNGELRDAISFDDNQERSMASLMFQLQPGENVITFESANDAGRAPGDPRDLAFSLLNVEPVLGNGQSCSYRG